MFVKPGPRQDDRDRPLVVRAPNGQFLSPLGEEVPDTQFWHRRLRDKDVVPATPIPVSPDVVRVGTDGRVVDGAPKAGPAGPLSRQQESQETGA
jgi:hypothetical protein